MQQYDFDVDILSMDCHCCFLLLAPFHHQSQYVLRLQWAQKLTINIFAPERANQTYFKISVILLNLRYLSGDFLLSFSSRGNVVSITMSSLRKDSEISIVIILFAAFCIRDEASTRNESAMK